MKRLESYALYILIPAVIAGCGFSSTDTPTLESELPSTDTLSTPPATPTNDTPVKPTEQACTASRGEPLFSTPGGTESVAVDQDGNLYTSDFCSGEVFRIQPDGTSSVLATLPYADENCTSNSVGVTVSDDGNVWVVVLSKKPEYNGVWKVEQGGSANLEFPMSPKKIPLPNDLAFDDARNLYITESLTGTIWRATPNGILEPWIQTELLAPPSGGQGDLGANGIAIFGNNLYIGNTSKDSIIKIPIEGDGKAGDPVIFATGISVPDGMAFNSQGELYVVSVSRVELILLSNEGEKITSIFMRALGVSYPTDVSLASMETNDTVYIPNLKTKGNANIIKLSLCLGSH